MPLVASVLLLNAGTFVEGRSVCVDVRERLLFTLRLFIDIFCIQCRKLFYLFIHYQKPQPSDTLGFMYSQNYWYIFVVKTLLIFSRTSADKSVLHSTDAVRVNVL